MFYTFETINYTYKGRDQSVVAEGKEAVCFFNIIVGVTIAEFCKEGSQLGGRLTWRIVID